jgi:hypothetical protein
MVGFGLTACCSIGQRIEPTVMYGCTVVQDTVSLSTAPLLSLTVRVSSSARCTVGLYTSDGRTSEVLSPVAQCTVGRYTVAESPVTVDAQAMNLPEVSSW